MKNVIRKIIKYIAVLLFTFGIIILLDHIFMPKYVNENQDGRITREFYENAASTDVVIIGASTVHYAISPMKMWEDKGITAYDRSNGSQTLWQSYYMLKDTLSVTKPKLIVLDMGFMKYGEEQIEEASNRKTIEAMRNPAAKYGAVKASMYEKEQPLSYYFPVLRYHSRWKELTAEDLTYAFCAPKVTYNGYLMDASIPAEQNIYDAEPLEEGYKFPEKACDYLNRIIVLCRENNLPLLLIKTPTYTNNWYEEYDAIISEIAADSGIKYVNFGDVRDEIGLNVRTDYIDDGEHMNIVGAEKFSQYFAEYLVTEMDIKDHQADELASVWNELYERYDNDRSRAMDEYEANKDALMAMSN